MAQPLVIIHGWSDDAKSFIALGKRLAGALNRPLEVINLAEWVSLNDDVTFTDLSVAMELAWQKLPDHAKPRSHDVLVHSTGALLVRDWMTRHYQPDTVPIKRFVQLAPANFGSPIAHQGRSILGRIYKGGLANGFETGTHLLYGLELASPYAWNLAERDLFPPADANGQENPWYGASRVLSSVFVGLKTYDGFAGGFAGSGSDGTVRVSTANLQATRLRLDMRGHPEASIDQPPKDMAMLPVDRFDHTSIVQSTSPTLTNLYTQALTVDDDGWAAWCADLRKQHDEIITVQHAARDEHRHAFQNTVMRVRDEFGHAVTDYLLKVELSDADDGFFARFFQSSAINHVHVHARDASHRALFIDVTEWKKRIDKEGEEVRITIEASPAYRLRSTDGMKRPDDKRRFNVGYESKVIPIPFNQLDAYFAPNRTLLVDVILPRRIDSGIVRIDPLLEVEGAY